MTLIEFENKISKITAVKGWYITLEYIGIWSVTIYDKETGKNIANTGTTGLSIVPKILTMPLNKCPWV